MNKQQNHLFKCRNCFYELQNSANFCTQCGQKNTDGRVSINSFFQEFISTLFNLDSKIFRTIRDLAVPGKLTLEYFKGRHKSYVHPVRLFLVCFLVMLLIDNTSEGFSVGFIEVAADKNPQNKQKSVITNDFHQWFYNKIYYPNRNEQSFLSNLDSLECALHEDFPIDARFKDSTKIKLLGLGHVVLSTKDLADLGTEELIEKYKVDGNIREYIFSQRIKEKKNDEALPNFIINNLVWIIFFMMPFLAVLLRLFDYKTKRYYVEHLVFTLHTHSFAFLALALSLGIINVFPILDTDYFVLPMTLIPYLYFFLALKKIYAFSYRATLFVFFFLNIVYLILLIIFMVLWILIGILLI